MLVADPAQLGIVTLAVRIVQNATTSQVVHGIAEPLTAATPHDHLVAFAALPGYRRSPAVSAEGVVVPLRQRIRAFGEELGSNQISQSWDGEQYAHVAMLTAVGMLATEQGHVIQQCLDSVADFVALAVEQAQLRQQQKRMLANGVGTAGAERQRRRPQNRLEFFRRPAPDAIFCEQ